MFRFAHLLTLLSLLWLLVGCATRDATIAADLEPGRLPAPDTTLAIAGFGPCTDNPDRRLHLDIEIAHGALPLAARTVRANSTGATLGFAPYIGKMVFIHINNRIYR